MVLTVAAALCLLVWIYLALGRGMFWKVEDQPAPYAAPPRIRVVAVVPARNEADTIGEAVSSLLRQEYSIDVIVVDDNSEDGTAHLARAAASDCDALDRFHLIHAAPLPAGWTGKLWAVSEGLKQAATLHPKYVLLTDADIRHDPTNVRGLLGRAEAEHLELASLMVGLRCESVWEMLLIPAFVFFFFKLYPPRWVADPKRSTAAAAGGCMLVRWTGLQAIGGIASIRDELIDDCALARRMKQRGRIWLGITRATQSIRAYEGPAPIWKMISRSAFTQLHYSAAELIGAIVGMWVVYLLPFQALALARPLSPAMWLSLGAVAILIALYSRMLRMYRLSPLWGLLMPAVALFYIGATVHSAICFWRGAGGEWKGRMQALRS